MLGECAFDELFIGIKHWVRSHWNTCDSVELRFACNLSPLAFALCHHDLPHIVMAHCIPQRRCYGLEMMTCETYVFNNQTTTPNTINTIFPTLGGQNSFFEKHYNRTVSYLNKKTREDFFQTVYVTMYSDAHGSPSQFLAPGTTSSFPYSWVSTYWAHPSQVLNQASDVLQVASWKH